MRTIYLDLSSGISGDMFIASFLDAGFSVQKLKNEYSKLSLSGYDISSRNVDRHHLKARQFMINVKNRRRRFTAKEIILIIKKSRLDFDVKKKAIEVFGVLFEAEKKVHKGLGNVHLHELGDIDTVLDVVGACVCMHEWRVGRLLYSNLTFGTGIIRGEILLPNPSPASLEIMKGIPAKFMDVSSELITPTGAAIVRALGEYCKEPLLKYEKIGYGAGSKIISELPNVLRLIICGIENSSCSSDSVIVLEASIDDTLPIVYTYVCERLFERGALDVYISQIQMKKSRPGQLLTVISPLGMERELAEIVLRETGTNGIRLLKTNRLKLTRKSVNVMTQYGQASVKLSGKGKDLYKASPEYSSIAALAKKNNVPFIKIYNSAVAKAITAVICAVLINITAFADSVFLNSGDEVKGIVVEEYADRVKISTVDGEKDFFKADIKGIEYDLPEQNLVALADKYMNAKNYETAYYYYEKAKTVNPSYKDAINGVNYLTGYLFRKESKKKLNEVNWYQEVNDFGSVQAKGMVAHNIPDIITKVGLELAEDGGNVVVQKVYSDSPAEMSGIKTHDVIASMWGKLCGYMKKEEIEAKMTEPENIEIKIQIDRIVNISASSIKNSQVGLTFDGYTLKNIDDSSEAYLLGLRNNDLLLSIDEKSIRYTPMDQVIKLLKGPVGKAQIRRDLTIWKEKEG